jgi:hypothetical protein
MEMVVEECGIQAVAAELRRCTQDRRSCAASEEAR